MLNHLWIAALLVLIPSGWGAPAAQDPSDPIVWSQVQEDGVVLALHVDKTFTASKMTEEGVLVTSSTAPPQGTGSAPTPMLTTTYKDRDDVTHTISTPVVSTTPGGMAAAITTHKDLVALMKAHYPPHP